MKKAAYLAAAGIFAAGFLLHFAYEWTGSALLGVFCPVNESVWEHLKLAFFPLIVWWFVYGWRNRLPFMQFAVAAAASAGTACLTIVLIHYAVEGIFGAAHMLVDIALLAAGLFLGQYAALAAVNRPHGPAAQSASILVCAALSLMMIVFTFAPPRIPLFFDRESGIYGIQYTTLNQE